jgi:hypothetical protein
MRPRVNPQLTNQALFCPPPCPRPSSHILYSGEATVVHAVAVTTEESSILQEHSACLEDEGGKQLCVDVVPGAVEPPRGDRRGEDGRDEVQRPEKASLWLQQDLAGLGWTEAS